MSVAERAPVTPLVAYHAVVASDVARVLLEVLVSLRVDDDPEVRLLEADLVRVRVRERVRVRVRVRVRARGRARVWVIRLLEAHHPDGQRACSLVARVAAEEVVVARLVRVRVIVGLGLGLGL